MIICNTVKGNVFVMLVSVKLICVNVFVKSVELDKEYDSDNCEVAHIR